MPELPGGPEMGWGENPEKNLFSDFKVLMRESLEADQGMPSKPTARMLQ
jgi:hypothetical protein